MSKSLILNFLFYLFLLEIIINYKYPNIIGRNTYLDFVGPSDTWKFLICRFNDTCHYLICFLIFNLINLVTHVYLVFFTKFNVAICNWLSNFCFLQCHFIFSMWNLLFCGKYFFEVSHWKKEKRKMLYLLF